MGEQEKKKDDGGGLAFLLLGVMLAIVVFINAPGESILALVADVTNLKLDSGQFWIFSLIISALVFVSMRFRYGADLYIKYYLYVCSAILFAYLLAHFGFHASIAARHVHYYFPP